MGEASKIEWCDHTFNPWIGCTKISGACDHCYAETLANRYGWAKWGPGAPRRMAAASTWNQPRKWDREAKAAGVRRKVFCASLADVFDAEVPDDWRVLVMEQILATPNLDWLLLTKRPQVAKKFFEATPAPRNVWLGTTVEDQKMADLRIPILLSIPGITVRFLSMEPLLGPVDLTTIHHTAAPGFFGDALQWHHRGKCHEDEGLQYPSVGWVIAGGESGPRARPAHPDWFRALRKQCAAAGVPFFFKQWGEWGPEDQTRKAVCHAIGNDGAHYLMSDLAWPDGARRGDAIRADFDKLRPCTTYKVGKKAAGAMLDGVEHRAFPT